MDFTLSDEQKLLDESARRFVRECYAPEQRRALVASERGYSEESWRQMAGLGWLAVGLPEDCGGIGGAVETMVLMEAFGAGLVLEPYVPSVVLGAGLVAIAGSAEQQRALLPEIARGERKLAFAYVEQQAGFDLFDVETRAARREGGFVLEGAKGVVLGAPTADTLVVSARTAGGARDEAGIGLFLVDREAPGVSLRRYATVDGLRAAEVTLDGVAVAADHVLGDPEGAWPAIETIAERAVAALCAEAVGAMTALVDATGEYLKTRQQFGRPIGKFQALQHRLVDMLIATEEARSLAYVATLRLDEPDARLRRHAVSGAKHLIGKHGRFVGQSAVQLHGGMGMTEEMTVGHYFKRLTMIDVMFGDKNYHLRRYAA